MHICDMLLWFVKFVCERHILYPVCVRKLIFNNGWSEWEEKGQWKFVAIAKGNWIEKKSKQIVVEEVHCSVSCKMCPLFVSDHLIGLGNRRCNDVCLCVCARPAGQ